MTGQPLLSVSAPGGGDRRQRADPIAGAMRPGDYPGLATFSPEKRRSGLPATPDRPTGRNAAAITPGEPHKNGWKNEREMDDLGPCDRHRAAGRIRPAPGPWDDDRVRQSGLDGAAFPERLAERLPLYPRPAGSLRG